MTQSLYDFASLFFCQSAQKTVEFCVHSIKKRKYRMKSIANKRENWYNCIINLFLKENAMKNFKDIFKTFIITAVTAAILFLLCSCGECEHIWKEGKCTECEAVCQHDKYTNGICDVCKLSCSHAKYTDGVCDECGYECPHTAYEENGCAQCGAPVPKIVVIVDGQTEYTLVYSASAGTHIMEFSDVMASQFGVFFDFFYTDTEIESGSKEILLGETNRQLSVQLYEKIGEYPSDSHVFGIMCDGESLAFAYNSDVAFGYMCDYIESTYTEGNLEVKQNLCYIQEKTKADYDAEQAAKEEEARNKRLAELAELNSAFTLSAFGGAAKNMTDSYNAPLNYPIDEHPRYMLTADMLPELREMLENPTYKNLTKDFWALANVKNGEKLNDGSSIYNEGVMTDHGKYSYCGRSLAAIEAKALAYLITADEVYGYEAIVGIKNAILTLDYSADVFHDEYRGADLVITVVCAVYDWCYDLLTDEDKEQLAAGVYNILGPQLEVGFPPYSMSAISGHGTGTQFLRTCMAVGITFYDEFPSWWEMIGGRFYQQFVPAVNVTVSGGWVSQGSCYAPAKLISQCQAAWIVKVGTGVMPFHENMANVHKYMLAERLPNGNLFVSGDGGASAMGYSLSDFSWLYYVSALFPNSGLSKLTNDYTSNGIKYSYGWLNVTPTVILTLMSQAEEPSDNGDGASDLLELVTYTAFPGGQLNSRSDWTGNAALVWMKLGGMTLGNHDHADAGTFQIYYKGMLTCDTGTYVEYGSDHWLYWHKATIAHNGLLVFDPDLSEAPEYDSQGNLLNTAKALYSGGQKILGEPSSFSQWTGGTYTMAKEKGHSYGYRKDGSPEYAYISGDLTNAYDVTAVDYVGRRMLTVYTGDDEFPMYFFVFDSVDSDKETSVKKFLLHTLTNPVIDEENKTVTSGSTGGDGVLVLHNITGNNVQIEKIGGKGHAYEINGVNVTEGKLNTSNDAASGIWGRVEISTTGQEESDMLNAMYVTDKSVTERLDVKRIGTDDDIFAGVAIKNIAAIFVRDSYDLVDSMSFTTEGSGSMTYYVSGVSRGTWKISVNGQSAGTAVCKEGEGFIKFTAPCGTVTLEPGTDIVPDGYGRVVYKNAYNMPQDYPAFYELGKTTSIADVIPTNGNDTFLGWYLDPFYEVKVDAIPDSAGKTITLYAKWGVSFASFDGESASRYASEVMGSVNKIDSNGKHYVEWSPEGMGPVLLEKLYGNRSFAKMNESIAVFEFTMSINEGATPAATTMRIMNSRYDSLELFHTLSDGSVVFAGNDQTVGTLTQEMQTFVFLVDFDEEIIAACDSDGNIVAQSSYSSLDMPRWTFTKYAFNWRAISEGVLNIGGINIYEAEASE